MNPLPQFIKVLVTKRLFCRYCVADITYYTILASHEFAPDR